MKTTLTASKQKTVRFLLTISCILLTIFLNAQDVVYKVGDKLEVLWSGNWYTAQILEINDGVYSIKYDVDGIVHSVKTDRMRPLKGYNYSTRNTTNTPPRTTQTTTVAGGRFKPGDRVEVDKASINSWEKGTVMPLQPGDKTDGTIYRVQLDKMKTMYIEGLPLAPERIRKAPAAEQETYDRQKAVSDQLFKKGSRVEVFTSKKWYKGQIVEANGDRYKIHYDGYTDYYDEWVTADQMRKPGTGTTTTEATDGARPQATMGANGLPLLPGTSWETLAIGTRGSEKVPQAPAYFNFCKSGKWSVNRYGNFGEIGSYKVAGNKVLITNNTDKSTTTYTMTWNATTKELQLQNGNFVMKFGLASKNACGEGF